MSHDKAEQTMILVDTSVWVDFFSDHSTQQVKLLVDAIENNYIICICDIIITEVLQGIMSDRDCQQTKKLFSQLTHINTSTQAHIYAANIYRQLRNKGITIRKTIDCIIAATSIDAKLPLLHHDKDFDQISKYLPLRTINFHNH